MALSLCSCAVLLASCRASADTRTGQADGYGGILRVQVMMEDGRHQRREHSGAA